MIPALAVGDRVTHRHYGPGEIVEVVSDISGMLRSNGGFMPVEADAIAADAVCIACRRNGITDIAMTALRAREAAQA